LFDFVDFVGIEIGVRISHKRASARTTAYFAQIETEQWRQAREDHSGRVGRATSGRAMGRVGNYLFNWIGYPAGSLTVPDTHEQVGRSGWLRHVLAGSTLWPDIRLRAERRLGEMIAREFPD
jgi:hypothetical protein